MIDSPLNELDRIIGHKPDKIEPGKAVYSFDCTPAMHSAARRLHGGVMFYVCDQALGAALFGLLDLAAGELPATLNLSIHYFRTVKDGKITVTARIVERQRTVAYGEAEVTGPDGKLLARATGAYYIQNRDRAKQG